MSISPLNKRQVPNATKKAMRAAHLMGKILKTHFDKNLCEFLVEKSFDYRSYSLNTLDNLLLVGGIPRDILLGTEVRDIDITLNLRELTKIQLNHLRKYHSKKHEQGPNIKCAYWQHYLNKFDVNNLDNVNSNNNLKNNMIKFHNNTYIFNSRFFIDILESSKYFQNKLTINDIPNHGFISCTINDHISHENYDLKGQKFEFTDTFDNNKVLSVQKLAQQQSVSNNNPNDNSDDNDNKSNTLTTAADPKKRTRWKSIALFPLDIDFSAEFDKNVKLIEIDIYDTKVAHKLLCYDFSINTAIIPLSSITEFCDNEDEVNIAIWFWEYIVENGLDECDAIKDITQNRVLRVPQPRKDNYIINIHPTTYHFWRTAELMIRLPNFYIDDDLITAHIENYNLWLNVQYFNNNKNRQNFIRKFRDIVVNYCKSVQDVRALLHVLEVLQFNNRFTKLLHKIKSLNVELMQAIQSTNNQQILVIFSSYDYPFIFGLHPMIQSQQSQQSQSQSQSQSQPQSQSNDVDQKALKALLDENQKLKKENTKLLQTIDALEKSKIQLAVATTKTIDQFRQYLLSSQNINNNK